MKKYIVYTLILFLSMLMLSGCTGGSDDFNTQAFTVDMLITANGGGSSNIEVEIRQGGVLLYPVLLVSGDELWVDAYGQEILLVDTGTSSSPIYTGSFSLNNSLEVFTIRLERANEVSARESVVILPDGFNISSPAAGDMIVQTGTFGIRWGPVSTPTDTIIFSGDCQDDNDQPFAAHYTISSNSGAENILVSDILGGRTLNSTGDCQIDIVIERQNIGSIDPNFESGSIVAKQVRSTSIIITP